MISALIRNASTPGSRQTQKVHKETASADVAARRVYQPTMIKTAAIRERAKTTSVSGPGQSRALDISAAATASRRISSAKPALRLGNVPRSRCILHSNDNATKVAIKLGTAFGLLRRSHFV
jgi:hypothetical protein